MRQKEHGNIVVYLLIAVVLLGGLTFTMSRSNQGENTESQLSQAQVEASAKQILSYAAAAQSVVDTMISQGIDPDEIDFRLPTATDFEDEPPSNITKLYHPSGGGLNYKIMPEVMRNKTADSHLSTFYVNRTNIEWTTSPDEEIIFMAYIIDEKVCEELNKRITGSSTMPAMTGDIGGIGRGERDFPASECPDCVEHNSICMKKNTGNFYSILLYR